MSFEMEEEAVCSRVVRGKLGQVGRKEGRKGV